LAAIELLPTQIFTWRVCFTENVSHTGSEDPPEGPPPAWRRSIHDGHIAAEAAPAALLRISEPSEHYQISDFGAVLDFVADTRCARPHAWDIPPFCGRDFAAELAQYADDPGIFSICSPFR
jgi:hypothetical protein